MKKYRLFSIICLVAALLLSACSQDELAENSTALPEGEYPLQIGSVTLTAEVSEQPWTRVVESTDGMSSVWEGNEQIGVQIGRGQPGIYTVQADGSVVAENPVYWTSTALTYVNAWYPMEDTVNLQDQSDRLAYVLNAIQDYVTYDQPVTLSFTHQLAKVRVVLSGTQASQVNAVKVYGITACAHLRGMTVNYDASNTGWINMKQQTYADGTEYWEANVVPGEVISQIKVNNTEATLTKPLTPKVAALNTITINVEQAPTEIDLDTYEGTTLTVSGETILKGDGTTPKDLQITVEAGAEVTLEDVVLSPSATGNAITCKGDATIILTGSNSLTAKSNSYNDNYYSSGIYVESGTLTIDGDGSLNISRTYASTSSLGVGAGIAAGNGANILIESGNIQIGDVPDDGSSSGPGIGSLFMESCGDITINGGTISIGKPSWYSACIGSAESGSCGDITISGESTVITFTKGGHAPCGIGNGDDGTCGTVTITDGATVNGVKYTETYTGTL